MPNCGHKSLLLQIAASIRMVVATHSKAVAATICIAESVAKPAICRGSQIADKMIRIARVETEMLVLAMTTFQTNAGQLITEHLPDAQHKTPKNAVGIRTTRLNGRLKVKEAYFGQAGRNLYEDVSQFTPCLGLARRVYMQSACGAYCIN